MTAVSIIVPIFNKAKSLETCIQSLLAQTLRSIEIICVDDCSTDTSRMILAEFEKEFENLRVITHEHNRGVGEARNTGLNAARGEYVSFVDADDALLPDALESIYNKCRETDADIGLYGLTYNFPSLGKTRVEPISLYLPYLPSGHPDPFTCDIAEERAFLFTGASVFTKLFKRSFLERIGARFTTHRIAEDLLFTYSALAKAKRITYVEEYPYLYNLEGGDGTTAQIDNLLVLLDALGILEKRLVDANAFDQYCSAFANLAMGHLDTMMQAARTSEDLESVFDEIVAWSKMQGKELFEHEGIKFAGEQYERSFQLIKQASYLDFLKYRFELAQRLIDAERGRADNLETQLAACSSDLQAVRKSHSYKVGNALMQIPSKAKRALNRSSKKD